MLFAWMLNAVYAGVLLLVSPILIWRAVRQGKYRRGLGQKFFGFVPARSGSRPAIWFHAVSVGETIQLQSVLQALRAEFPDHEYVVSVSTATAYDVAVTRYADCRVIFFPLDFSWSVAAALHRIHPAAVVLVELELWPNFIAAAHHLQIPVLLVNGRISERSFRGYRRIRWLMKPLLRKLSIAAVQTPVYGQRLIELGADPSRVVVTGSIKFDTATLTNNPAKSADLRSVFGLAESDVLFLAGSTQAPEERYAVECYMQLKPRFPELRLLLVPRHAERFEEVAALVAEEFRLPLLRRSQLTKSNDASSRADATGRDDSPVLLLDTLGELGAAWSLAASGFVGGSLTQRGGQNMIEPASCGVPVMFGPNTWNFKDVVELLRQFHAAVVIHNRDEMQSTLERWLTDPATARHQGERGRSAAASQQGATTRTVAEIRRLLTPTVTAAGCNVGVTEFARDPAA